MKVNYFCRWLGGCVARWLGGWSENWRVMLISTKILVEVEVEIGNNYVFHQTVLRYTV